MTKGKQAIIDHAFLRAALEGLELQRQRIDEQILYVESLLGRRDVRSPQAPAGSGNKPVARRELSAAARRRIAAAQRKRWAAYRKSKAAKAQAKA